MVKEMPCCSWHRLPMVRLTGPTGFNDWKLHKPAATRDAGQLICRTQLLCGTSRTSKSCPQHRHRSFAPQNKHLPTTSCLYRTADARGAAAQGKQQAGSVFAQLYRCTLYNTSIWNAECLGGGVVARNYTEEVPLHQGKHPWGRLSL